MKEKEAKGDRTNLELGVGDPQHFQYQVQLDLLKLFRNIDAEMSI